MTPCAVFPGCPSAARVRRRLADEAWWLYRVAQRGTVPDSVTVLLDRRCRGVVDCPACREKKRTSTPLAFGSRRTWYCGLWFPPVLSMSARATVHTALPLGFLCVGLVPIRAPVLSQDQFRGVQRRVGQRYCDVSFRYCLQFSARRFGRFALFVGRFAPRFGGEHVRFASDARPLPWRPMSPRPAPRPEVKQPKLSPTDWRDGGRKKWRGRFAAVIGRPALCSFGGLWRGGELPGILPRPVSWSTGRRANEPFANASGVSTEDVDRVCDPPLPSPARNRPASAGGHVNAFLPCDADVYTRTP